MLKIVVPSLNSSNVRLKIENKSIGRLYRVPNRK